MQLFVVTVLEEEAVRKNALFLASRISKLSPEIKELLICGLRRIGSQVLRVGAALIKLSVDMGIHNKQGIFIFERLHLL